MPNASHTVTGRVTGTNENGVQIDGTWYNYSRYNFKGTKGEAQKGQAVSALATESNGREYLNELTIVGNALPNGGGNTPVSAGGGNYRNAETNERIARQVALKAAVDNGPGRDPATVIADARIFEKFLAEPYGEVDVEDAA